MNKRRATFPALAICAAGVGGCFGRVIDIFPSQQCPPRDLIVALSTDPDASPSLHDEYHSTAGCTIHFDVMEFHVLITDSNDPRWTPAGGLKYELRVLPLEPDGREETGILPSDAKVSVPTVAGNRSVVLTVYAEEYRPGSGEPFTLEVSAVVYLEDPE